MLLSKRIDIKIVQASFSSSSSRKKGFPASSRGIPFRRILPFFLLQVFFVLAPPPGQSLLAQSPRSFRAPGNEAGEDGADQNPAREQKPAGKDKSVKETRYELECIVTLGDGRKIKGKAKFSAPESMVVTHTQEGLSYEKKVRIDQIRQIDIKQWKGEPLRENKNGWVYAFHVTRFNLRLSRGVNLALQSDMFPFLKEFTFKNKNGELRLFTFWLDLKNKDGSWYTGIQGPSDGTRNVSHKDVVNRIDFTGK